MATSLKNFTPPTDPPILGTSPQDYPSASDIEQPLKLTPIQLKYLRALVDGSTTINEIHNNLSSPELRDPTFLSLLRYGWSSYKAVKKIKEFLGYGIKNVYKGTQRFRNGNGVESLDDPSLGTDAHEFFGLNRARIKLGSEDEEAVTKRDREVGMGRSQAQQAEYFAKEIQSQKSLANPRLTINFDAYYATTEETVKFAVPLIFSEMEYSSESDVSPLNILGRNLKRYHYAGSEDTFDLKLIHKVEFLGLTPMQLAANILNLTKADQHGDVPLLTLTFSGVVVDSFFPISSNATYILVKAPIKPSRFKPIHQSVQPGTAQMSLSEQVDFVTRNGLSPQPMYIEQTLSLKRIAESPLSLYPHLSQL